MRRFPTTVTFQEPVLTRTPSGGVLSETFDTVDGMADLPARVVAAVEERRTDRLYIDSDLFDIYVAGDIPVRPEMVALTEFGVMDVKRVANPTLGQPTNVTIVVAERVAL